MLKILTTVTKLLFLLKAAKISLIISQSKLILANIVQKFLMILARKYILKPIIKNKTNNLAYNDFMQHNDHIFLQF